MIGIVFLKDTVGERQPYSGVTMSASQYYHGQEQQEVTPNEGFKPKTTGEKDPGSFPLMCRWKVWLLVLCSRV